MVSSCNLTHYMVNHNDFTVNFFLPKTSLPSLPTLILFNLSCFIFALCPLCNIIFCFIYLEKSPPPDELLVICLTSMGIRNETHVFKIVRLSFICKRKHAMFSFPSFDCHTQNNCSQFHPFMCKFNFLSSLNNLLLCMWNISFIHLLVDGDLGNFHFLKIVNKGAIYIMSKHLCSNRVYWIYIK